MFSIRNAQTRDLEILYNLDGIVFGWTIAPPMEYITKCVDEKRSFVVTLSETDEIIANAILQFFEKSVLIVSMYVVFSYRNRGVGRKFLKYLEEQCVGKQHIGLYVKRNNINAIHFYELNGYKQVGKEDDTYFYEKKK